MKKKIYKLTGVKLSKGNLIVDGPVKEFGIRRKMEMARQLFDLQSDMDILDDKLDETKVTGKG